MAVPFLPLLATMSKAARTAWPFIQRGIGDGMSANAIGEALSDAGVGIRRQDLLALAREARGAALLRSDLERLPRDLLLSEARVREAVTKIVAPYGYTVEVEVLNERTGGVELRQLTAHSNELRAFEQVEQAFMDEAEPNYPFRGESIVSARVVDVYRSGGPGVI